MKEIVCPSCGYANEISRIFCHQCGVRLPRTAEHVKEVADANKEALAKGNAVRQGKRIVKPKERFDFSDFLAGLIVSAIKLSLLALVASALVLVFRAPQQLPLVSPDSADAEHLAQQLQNKLLEIDKAGYSGHLLVNQAQVNAFLSRRIKMQAGQMTVSSFLRPESLAVEFQDKAFTLFLGYQFVNFPILLQTRFAIEGEPKKWTTGPGATFIGSLPVHPWLVSHAFRWYSPIAETLATPLNSLSLAAELTLTPQFLRVAWKGESLDSQPISGFDNAPSLRAAPRPNRPAANPDATPLQMRGASFGSENSASPTSQPAPEGAGINEQLGFIQEKNEERNRQINEAMDAANTQMGAE